MAADRIWECKTSDGISTYFDSELEAAFFRAEKMAAGFGVRIQPIPVPKTPKSFAAFMERQFNAHRESLLAAKKLADGGSL